MSDRVKSGIYVITNTVTGDCYIGSSMNMEKRLTQHRYLLHTGRHHSKLLQAAWDQFGEDAFVFDALEIVSDTNALLVIEQRYLDERHPKYNPAKTAIRNVSSIVRDPEYYKKAEEGRRAGRLEMMAMIDGFNSRIRELMKIVERDDDIMKVLDTARALSPLERAIIEQFAELAKLVYGKGMVSGKDFITVIEKLLEGLYDGETLRDILDSKVIPENEWIYHLHAIEMAAIIVGVGIVSADISQMERPANQDMWDASYSAGREIREMMLKHGIVPEDMPPEPHISDAKRLASGQLPLLPGEIDLSASDAPKAPDDDEAS